MMMAFRGDQQFKNFNFYGCLVIHICTKFWLFQRWCMKEDCRQYIFWNWLVSAFPICHPVLLDQNCYTAVTSYLTCCKECRFDVKFFFFLLCYNAYVDHEGDDDGYDGNDKLDTEVRKKRQAEQYEYTPTKTRCPLLLVADYRFYQEMGGSNTKTTINYLVRALFLIKY